MRVIISMLIMTIVLALFGLSGYAQKKDSVQVQDTIYVFRQNDISALKAIIMNSKITGEDGQPFTGNQLLQLLNWMDSRRTIIPKQQPKK